MQASGQLHAPTALPQEKSPRYTMDTNLRGPQSHSWSGGEEKKIPAPAGNRNPVVRPVA